MTDSASGSEFEVVSSQKDKESFDFVPSPKEYKFKCFGTECSKSGTRFLFHLKEGKSLPYETFTITKKGKGI